MQTFFALDKLPCKSRLIFLFIEGHHELSTILTNPNFSHGKDKLIGAWGNTSKELTKLKFLYFWENILTTIISQEDSVALGLFIKR